jgi:hypothetical protein
MIYAVTISIPCMVMFIVWTALVSHIASIFEIIIIVFCAENLSHIPRLCNFFCYSLGLCTHIIEIFCNAIALFDSHALYLNTRVADDVTIFRDVYGQMYVWYTLAWLESGWVRYRSRYVECQWRLKDHRHKLYNVTLYWRRYFAARVIQNFFKKFMQMRRRCQLFLLMICRRHHIPFAPVMKAIRYGACVQVG